MVLKISILNGNSAGNQNFDVSLINIAGRLTKIGHTVDYFNLREMDIKQCVGCFGCWIKTPGLCNQADGHEAVLRSFVGSDIALFASPLIMGYSSSLLKRAYERFLPSVLPLLDGKSQVCRHVLRYGKAPAMALLYEPEQDTDTADIEILTTIWHRMARNVHKTKTFVRSIHEPLTELCNEIDSL